MGTPTLYYVDPAIAGDSGTGAIGDPFGDLQYALNTVTRDATNGDQFNIKAGTAEVLAAALTLATYGTPTIAAPLILRGYTTAANDGGVGEINCNGVTMWAAATYDYLIFIDLNIHNGGNNHLVSLRTSIVAFRCQFSRGASTPSSKRLFLTSGPGYLYGCLLSDPGASGVAVDLSNGGFIYGNYINLGTATNALAISAASAYLGHNIVRCGATGQNGFALVSATNNAWGNIICQTTAGTGIGINLSSAGRFAYLCMNNIITGFSGVGGKAIADSGGGAMVAGYNAFYNNATNYGAAITHVNLTANDVTLAADPFTSAATGDFSLTAAGKTALRGLGWPMAYLGAHANTDGHVTIGAVQYGEDETVVPKEAVTPIWVMRRTRR